MKIFNAGIISVRKYVILIQIVHGVVNLNVYILKDILLNMFVRKNLIVTRQLKIVIQEGLILCMVGYLTQIQIV